jgi:hypothetical protein
LPQTFAAGAAAFLVKDVQKLQPLQQQQQQQQQQIKRPASASSVNMMQSSSAPHPLHPSLLSRSDSLPPHPDALSRSTSAPKPLALFSSSASSAEIDTPWSPADFDAAKADILSLTQARAMKLATQLFLPLHAVNISLRLFYPQPERLTSP